VVRWIASSPFAGAHLSKQARLMLPWELGVLWSRGQSCGMDEIHYSEQPMRQQFRFGSERQSRSSRLVAERSPVCKHELCRFASKAVVMGFAAGSDERGQLRIGRGKRPPLPARAGGPGARLKPSFGRACATGRDRASPRGPNESLRTKRTEWTLNVGHRGERTGLENRYGLCRSSGVESPCPLN
jgi:hypothetical protein